MHLDDELAGLGLRYRHITVFENVFVILGDDPAGFHNFSIKNNRL
jgi:hypothetical protein